MTLDIDDDVLDAARELAQARRTSLGSVISALARTGLQPVGWKGRSAFPSSGRGPGHR